MDVKKTTAGIVVGVILFGGIGIAVDLNQKQLVTKELIDSTIISEQYIQDEVDVISPVDGKIKNKEITATRDVVLYAYNTGVKIVPLTNETVERRTSNSRTLKTGNTYSVYFDTGLPQYYKDENGEWWYAGYATTTQEEYSSMQDAQLSIGQKIINILIPRAFAQTTTFITSGTTYAVPSDWNNANNSIQVIGGGGSGGSSGGAGLHPRGAGGGGEYRKATNVTMPAGTSVTIQIGQGGAAVSGNTTGNAGTNTYICNSTSNCASIAGSAVVAGAVAGGAGGSFSGGAGGTGGVGAAANSPGGAGGDGNASNFNGGSGGGGAGGPSGTGAKGGTASGSGGGGGGGNGGGSVGSNSGGNGGDNIGGTGHGTGGASTCTAGTAGGGGGAPTSGNVNACAGGVGTEFDATHGSGGGGGATVQGANPGNGGAGGLYGAGGAGKGDESNGSSGAGAAGIIVIIYTAAPVNNTAIGTPSTKFNSNAVINAKLSL